MRFITVSVLTCCVIGTFCDKPPCDGNQPMSDNVRIKRAKYYSNPPPRYYRRLPTSHPSHGAFSYTPPPSYMMDDEEQLPRNHRYHRYTKRPSNEGLGDEDIINLMKFLSKKDLDKIVEYAVGKDKIKDGYYDKPFDVSKPDYNNNEDTFQDVDNGNRFSLNGPYVRPNDGYKQTTEYQNVNTIFSPESIPIVVSDTSQNIPGKLDFNTPLTSEETVNNEQFAVVHGFMQQAVNGMGNEKDLNRFTDSKVMDEQRLPAPVSSWHEDYDASFTNNVPAVIKAESSSYKIENFGNLPLMDYNSKLDSVSSYHVPHYTVTTSNRNQPSASPLPALPPPPASGGSTPALELAPSVSNYRDQSDAHLKATKIWTHKSRGTAYTLHKDGTLSLERPLRSPHVRV